MDAIRNLYSVTIKRVCQTMQLNAKKPVSMNTAYILILSN